MQCYDSARPWTAQRPAIRAAPQHPSRSREGLGAERLCPTPREIAGVADLQRAVESFDDRVSEQFAREFQVSTIYRPIPAEFLDGAVAESLRLPARVWQSIMTGMLATDIPIGLRGTRIPTLVLWGDRDAVFPRRAQQDALVGLLGGAATIEVYPETGHALHWERPEKFASDLRAFVARTAAR